MNASLLTGIFVIALLSACASTPQTRNFRESPPADIQPRVELDSVPFFPQRDYQCGPAALATVLKFQGVSVSPDDLVSKVYLPARKGSLQIEMIATGRNQGLLAYKIEPSLVNLLKEINQGNPVLVFQNMLSIFWPQWHYAVVVGYDVKAEEIILRSGTERRYHMSFAAFERTWQRARHWAYVFVRPGIIPATATPLTYTRAVHDLDNSGFSDLALLAYRQSADRWPDHSVVLMSLGNAEYTAQNYDKAEQAFRHELLLRATNASAWNNLAYTLMAKNCRKEAVNAIRCAQSLLPEDDNIQHSLIDIKNMPDKDFPKKNCKVIECPKTLESW